MHDKIFEVGEKKEEKFLRQKTEDFDFKKFNRKEIGELVLKMKKIMRGAHGIGLSANQIGLDLKVFVAEVPSAQGGLKFYAIFNPKIEKAGKETVPIEEGCLSIPGVYGEVERSEKVTLSGYDKNGGPIKIKAWGLLARVFQHEIDHLEGKLFIDKARKIQTVPRAERLKNLRRKEINERVRLYPLN